MPEHVEHVGVWPGLDSATGRSILKAHGIRFAAQASAGSHGYQGRAGDLDEAGQKMTTRGQKWVNRTGPV